MAAADALKKPQPAYWLWLADNRENIAKTLGTGKGSEVAKKGGEMWKALSDAGKLPYEKKAKEQKDAYDKFVATEGGKKALDEKKAAKAEEKAGKSQKVEAKAEKVAAKEVRKNERACNVALKSIVKDDALKKPQTAYWLWLGDNRDQIASTLGSKKGPDVAKKGGEMWKALSDVSRAPYEKKAKEQKDVYDKYIASAEGATALQAFKSAQQAAKDQFKPPESEPTQEVGTKREPPAIEKNDEDVAEAPAKKAKTSHEDEASAKEDKKAAINEKKAATANKKASKSAGKKNAVVETMLVEIPQGVLAKADEAGMAGALKKLLCRDDIKDAKISPSAAMSALEGSGGLLHKARAALLGA